MHGSTSAVLCNTWGAAVGGANSLGCNGRRGCEKGLPPKARDVSTQSSTMIMEGFASTERGSLLAVPIWHEDPRARCNSVDEKSTRRTLFQQDPGAACSGGQCLSRTCGDWICLTAELMYTRVVLCTILQRDASSNPHCSGPSSAGWWTLVNARKIRDLEEHIIGLYRFTLR